MKVDAFIRFSDEEGEIHHGAVSQEQLRSGLEGRGLSINTLSGTPFEGFQIDSQRKTVSKVLCPLESTPLIICIGLNYKTHAEEGKNPIPEYPVVFTKPADALAGPYDTIPVHVDCQSLLDYEGELTVVIGRDAKNVTESEALSYVLGYTCGNDVSARNFQKPRASGGQFCYAKSFDAFAPIGPAVVLAHTVADPQTLQLFPNLNCEVRQQTCTDDMIWTVAQIIEHLSRGTTLRKGTVIMTGTPSGVGCFMQPLGVINDGDVVEVGIEGFGRLANRYSFED